MILDFIKEYKNLFEVKNLSGFDKDFFKFKSSILDPENLPSLDLIEKLNYIESLISNPLQIAVVGQFSSGKSSFLNAIIKSEVLPTGIIPVTAKPVKIKYAPSNMLKVVYENGSEEYLDLNELSGFVDQRAMLRSVKLLTIYLNLEFLKEINFIDTPGFNSKNDADTKETLQILDDASSLIWISLIDNAAKKSEKFELEKLGEKFKNRALCLLNGKDKIPAKDVDLALLHAKNTYRDYFANIIPISAKNELNNKGNSGFDEVLASIEKLKVKKQYFIIKDSLNLKNKLIKNYEEYHEVLGELNTILNDFQVYFDKNLNDLKLKAQDDLNSLFTELFLNTNSISNVIFSALKSEDKSYFRPVKKFFGKNKYEKFTYEKMTLDEDFALRKLIYNDDKLAKFFRKFKRKLLNLQKEILKISNDIYQEFHINLLSYSSQFIDFHFENKMYFLNLIQKIHKLASQIVNSFDVQVNAIFNEFEAKINLYFSEIYLKIISNYEAALKLTLSFFSNKIEESALNYESDPANFALYFPNLKEINEKLLEYLKIYEFKSPSDENPKNFAKVFDELSLNFNKNLSANLSLLLKFNMEEKANVLKNLEL